MKKIYKKNIRKNLSGLKNLVMYINYFTKDLINPEQTADNNVK